MQHYICIICCLNCSKLGKSFIYIRFIGGVEEIVNTFAIILN